LPRIIKSSFFNEKGCDYCHTPSAELPLRRFSVAKQLMDYDVQLGYNFNLQSVRTSLIDDKPVSQSGLNKMSGLCSIKRCRLRDTSRCTGPAALATAVLRYSTGLSTSASATMPALIPPRSIAMNLQPIPKKLPVDERKAALGFLLTTRECPGYTHFLRTLPCVKRGRGRWQKNVYRQGGAVGPINAPTVFNSVFNIEQFWDGRASTLQEQAGGPPLNPIEMASKSWGDIINKLDKDPVLKKDFWRLSKVLAVSASLTLSLNLKKH
jgi:cytochrome c peroxidase